MLYSIYHEMKNVRDANNEYEEYAANVDLSLMNVQLQNVITMASNAGFATSKHHRGFKLVVAAPAEEEEDEPDLYANEEPDGYPMFSFMSFHWSNIRTVASKKTKENPVLSNSYFALVFETSEIGQKLFEGVDTWNVDDGGYEKDTKKLKNQLKAKLDEDLTPENDDFAALMDSSLLVQGQTSSLYSYLGSRTHFRASVLLTGIFEEVDGSRSTFTDNVLFGPHLTFKSLAPDPTNPPKAIAFVDDKLTVNKSMRDNLLAEDTREEKQQQLIENTCCDYTKVLVQDLKQKNKRVMFSIEKACKNVLVYNGK